MDTEFKTTFIPKRKLTQSRTTRLRRNSGNSFLFLIAILLFVTAIVSAVGVSLYKVGVESSVRTKIESIKRAEKAFEPTVIIELKKLDIRLKAATELLNQHVAFSDFFDALGSSTLPDVAFSEMTLEEKDGATYVTMTGQASGYLPIAQQSDLFEKNLYIQNPVFSDFQVDEETGNVGFSVEFSLNPDLIRYGRIVKNLTTEEADAEGVLIRHEKKTVSGGKQVDFTNLSGESQ